MATRYARGSRTSIHVRADDDAAGQAMQDLRLTP
jgi:hypothetical protein